MTTIEDVLDYAYEAGNMERRMCIDKARGFDVRNAYNDLRAAIEQYAAERVAEATAVPAPPFDPTVEPPWHRSDNGPAGPIGIGGPFETARDRDIREACAELRDALGKPVISWTGDQTLCGQTIRMAAARLRGSGEPIADFSAEAVRADFEASFMDYFGRGPTVGYFDQPGTFWLKREGGRYAEARVDDAWTGWLAAARKYAHVEHMARLAKLGHEQIFADCQRLTADRDALQAKIDALMLEYCPDEMSTEQVAEWGKHQKPWRQQHG